MVCHYNHGYRESAAQKVDSEDNRPLFQPFPFHGKSRWNKPKANQHYKERLYRQNPHRLFRLALQNVSFNGKSVADAAPRR